MLLEVMLPGLGKQHRWYACQQADRPINYPCGKVVEHISDHIILAPQ